MNLPNLTVESVAWFASFVLNTALGIFVYLKNKQNRLNLSFAAFAVSVAFWSLNVLGSYIAVPESINAWEKYSCIGLLFIPPTGYYFLTELSKSGKGNKSVILSFIISLVFVAMNMADFFVFDFRKVGPKYAPVPSVPYVLFVLDFVFWAVLGFWKIIKSYRASSSLQYRNQIKYFFSGIFLMFFFGLGNFLFSMGIASYSLGGLASVFFTGMVAYAIVKHNALEIRVVIRRSMYYLTLTASVAVTYCLVVGLFTTLTGRALFGNRSLLVDAFSAAVSVAIFLPFKDKIQEILDRIFFREKVNYANVTKEFSRSLGSTVGLLKVIDYVSDFISDVLHTKKIVIFLFDEETQEFKTAAAKGAGEGVSGLKIKNGDPLASWLIKNKRVFIFADDKMVPENATSFPCGFHLAAPLMVKNILTGVILTGEKISEETYRFEDLEILSAMANQSAAFIENARLYEKMRELEKNLYHTDKMSALGVLASSIAHEVKNPLMAVKTFVDLMSERKKDKAFITNFLNIVPVEITRINKIINELLEFGRQRETQFTLIRVDSVIESILELTRYEISKNGIRVERKFPDYIPFVLADEEQIKQVFLNIILNGLQEMTNNGILLVEIRHLAAAGEIEISIGDTGPGIDEKIAGSIFKPFFTTKRNGSGLGLAISKRIISQHNGKIDVGPNREFGTGTVFSISLPVASITPVQEASIC